MTGESSPLAVTNIHVFRAIAEEAASEARRLLGASRRPKPDGEPGWIITFDPERKSFKQALIAIAFAGMYLEALLGLAGTKRLGLQGYRKIERMTYEEKLKRLGVEDEALLTNCKRFRDARNELTHEKTYDTRSIRVAQEECAHAIEVVELVTTAVGAQNSERPERGASSTQSDWHFVFCGLGLS